MINRPVWKLCFSTLLFVLMTLVLAAPSFGQLIVVRFGPPALPVYEQPYCPGDNYIWTPGYWAYNYDYNDYYWVPGTWVLAPERGLLWTPAYWGWNGNGYQYYPGYWGPRVGFYGGVNYGYGYYGEGYQGGRWQGDRFFYNREANRVNVTQVRNVYVTKIVNVYPENRVSYNGGQGGLTARPTRDDDEARREKRMDAAPAQRQQVQVAEKNPQLRASANKGKPPVAATAKAGDFDERAAVPAKQAGGTYNPPNTRGGGQPEGNGPANRAEQPNRNADRNDNQGNRPGQPDNSANRNENNRSEQPDRNNNNVDRNPGRPDNSPDARPEPNNNRPEPNKNNDNDRPKPAVHPKDIPPRDQAPPPNSGNAKWDQQYEQQIKKQQDREDRDRQKLQARQDKEDQRLAQQRADDMRKQQMEQNHQQQTQKLQQREQDQEQKMQNKHPKPQGQPESHPNPPDNQPH